MQNNMAYHFWRDFYDDGYARLADLQAKASGMNEQLESGERSQIDVERVERIVRELTEKIRPSDEVLTALYEQALVFGGVFIHVSFDERLELRTRLVSREEFSRMFPKHTETQISSTEGKA